MNKFKQLLLNIPIVGSILEYFNRVRITGTFQVGILPQNEKAKLLLSYAKRYNCRSFVETGTYKGDMIDSCLNSFDSLTSIELSHDLFMASKNRFLNNSKVNIIEGNSEDILPKIIKLKNQPTLFWLDAHYSGGKTARGPEDSPIISELKFILNLGDKNCILIDDARCFNGKSGYPKIDTVRDMVLQKNKEYGYNLAIEVRDDIIRIAKKI